MIYATCVTDDCPEQGIAKPCPYVGGTGATVYCGGCTLPCDLEDDGE